MGDPNRNKRKKKRSLQGCCKDKNNKKARVETESSDNHNSEKENSPEILSPPRSASKAKVRSIPTTAAVTGDDGSERTELSQLSQEGLVIIDANLLCQFLSKNILCPVCSNIMKCGYNSKQSKGFAHTFLGYCETCDDDFPLFCSSEVAENNPEMYEHGEKGTPHSVNIRMVSFVRSIGKGHQALVNFSRHLNSPPPMTKNNYEKLMKHQHSAAKKVALSSMETAAKELLDESDGEKNVSVSVDGSWQRRGYSSHNGLTTVCSVKTGKCLDIEVLSNFCKGCCRLNKLDKNSTEYIDKLAKHKPKCQLNHTDNAGSMEGAGALKIFNRSEDNSGLIYSEYLGDGDSSAYKTVSDSKPYGDRVDIKKLECVGHVQKRVGSRLRQLKKDLKGKKLSDGKNIGGKGRLTDSLIDTLQNYFGMAIRENTDSLVNMQNAVYASLYHVASTDKNPQHGHCPSDSWCKYGQDGFKHKHGIPEAILEYIIPIYDSLADADLLNKCLHGKTQNVNEALHKLVWDRCSKTVFVRKFFVEESVYCAVSHYNDGLVSLLDRLKLLGVTPGHFTVKNCSDGNRLRIRHSDYKSAEPGKKRRKALRALKKGFETEQENKDYVSGAF